MDVEILWDDDLSTRAARMFQALVDAAPDAGIRPIISRKWTRNNNVLMSYGLGHPRRRLSTEAHVKNGGRLIGWDLAYWDRDNAMRCTVDNLHPWRLIRDMPSDRLEDSGILLREDSNPNGHIVLVGMGHKSRSQFSMQDRDWERSALKSIQLTYPGKDIVYKPKRPEEVLRGARTMNGPIEQALSGASLVVCRHSNVAVDACIAGIPVVCEDGAAKAIYGNDIMSPVAPTLKQRTKFLENLAYWQWKPEEACKAWFFLKGVIRGN